MTETGKNGNLPEIYFNVKQQEWLVGEGAYQAQLSSLGPGETSEDIYNILEVLMGKLPLPEQKKRPWRRVNGPQDLIEIGQYAMALVHPRRLTPRMVNRGSQVNLTPTDQAFINHFDSFPNFLDKIDGREIGWGAFDHWLLPDFVKYIKEVSNLIGRKPAMADFNRVAKDSTIGNEKPSAAVIRSRFPLSELYELAGYPYIPAWSKDDYVAWGTQFVLSNPEAHITSGLKHLSSKGLGPSTRAVANEFGTLSEFRKISLNNLERIRAIELSPREKYLQFKKSIEGGELPKAIEQGALYEEQLSSRCAKFSILDEIDPDMDELVKVDLAKIEDVDDFLIMSYQQNQNITPSRLQTVATNKGLLFNVWSPSILDRLKVPVSQINSKRPPVGDTTVLSITTLPNGMVLKKLAPGYGSSRKRRSGNGKARSNAWKSRSFSVRKQASGY